MWFKFFLRRYGCFLSLILLFSCEGSEVSKPKLTLAGVNPSDQVNRGERFVVTINFIDNEGDMDSLYMNKIVKGIDDGGLKKLVYKFPNTTNVLRGRFDIVMINHEVATNDPSAITMVDLSIARDHEVSYHIWAVDKAKHVSDTIRTPFVLVKSQ